MGNFSNVLNFRHICVELLEHASEKFKHFIGTYPSCLQSCIICVSWFYYSKYLYRQLIYSLFEPVRIKYIFTKQIYLAFMMCLCEFQENIPMYYIMYLCYFHILCILYKYIGTIGTYYIVLKIAIICRYFILLYVLRE